MSVDLVEQLAAEARLLAADDQLRLVDRILELSLADHSGFIDQESLAVYARRDQELESGSVAGIPWKEAVNEIEKELHERQSAS